MGDKEFEKLKTKLTSMYKQILSEALAIKLKLSEEQKNELTEAMMEIEHQAESWV